MARVNRLWQFIFVEVAFACHSLADDASFTPIGDVPGGSTYSRALSVSPDSQYIVGQGDASTGTVAWRWAGGSLAQLDVPGLSYGFGVACDGTVVGSFVSNDLELPYLWMPQGLQVLETLYQGGQGSALNISSGGNIVVGQAWTNNGELHPVIWHPGGGIMSLGTLPGAGFPFGTATAVSLDGRTVVGFVRVGVEPNSPYQAFRWTEETGMLAVDNLSGAIGSKAYDVSADGTVIVGQVMLPNSQHAFRWTVDGAMVDLGIIPGSTGPSTATCVSSDGLVVAGECTGGPTFGGMIWDATNGMRSVRQVLKQTYGLSSVQGWILTGVNDLSSDGRTLVGEGFDPSHNLNSWMARIPRAPGCAGDCNGDGIIDLPDLAIVLSAYGSTACSPQYSVVADLDNDGIIGLTDLAFSLSVFGTTCP